MIFSSFFYPVAVCKAIGHADMQAHRDMTCTDTQLCSYTVYLLVTKHPSLKFLGCPPDSSSRASQGHTTALWGWTQTCTYGLKYRFGTGFAGVQQETCKIPCLS